jgi:hypothetical protein
MEVFWVSILLSSVNFLLVLLVFPESLSRESRAKAVSDYSGKGKGKSRAEAANAEDGVVVDDREGEVGGSRSENERGAGHGDEERGIINTFLRPLAIFLPVVIMDGSKKRTDWSLTFLAGAMLTYMLSTVSQ